MSDWTTTTNECIRLARALCFSKSFLDGMTTAVRSGSPSRVRNYLDAAILGGRQLRYNALQFGYIALEEKSAHLIRTASEALVASGYKPSIAEPVPALPEGLQDDLPAVHTLMAEPGTT